jgi:hypothetical protein
MSPKVDIDATRNKQRHVRRALMGAPGHSLPIPLSSIPSLISTTLLDCPAAIRPALFSVIMDMIHTYSKVKMANVHPNPHPSLYEYRSKKEHDQLLRPVAALASPDMATLQKLIYTMVHWCQEPVLSAKNSAQPVDLESHFTNPGQAIELMTPQPHRAQSSFGPSLDDLTSLITPLEMASFLMPAGMGTKAAEFGTRMVQTGEKLAPTVTRLTAAADKLAGHSPQIADAIEHLAAKESNLSQLFGPNFSKSALGVASKVRALPEHVQAFRNYAAEIRTTLNRPSTYSRFHNQL